jgi:peroxiredoxin
MRNLGALAAMAMVLPCAYTQEIPRPAPEFIVHLSDGSQVKPSQYSGKVVLLAFMATT